MGTSRLWLFVYSTNKANSSHEPTFFLGISTLFLLTLYSCGKEDFQKKSINIFGMKSPDHRLANRRETYFVNQKNTSKYWRTWSLTLSAYNFLCHLPFFKVGEIMVSKYGNLMLTGTFLDKVVADIDFTGEAVVYKCLQMIEKISQRH